MTGRRDVREKWIASSVATPAVRPVGLGRVVFEAARVSDHAASEASGPAIAVRGRRGVTETPATDARDATMTVREDVGFAIARKVACRARRGSAKSGASGLTGSATRAARVGTMHDIVPDHRWMDRGHRGRDVQWEE